MSKEDTKALICTRLGMLINVFGKRTSEVQKQALERVWCDALGNLPAQAITDGFNKAEHSCERFPTPKSLRALCTEFMPSGAWKYDFSPSVDEDGVEVLIDPDPTCTRCREPRSIHPTAKCQAWERSKLGDHRLMYRPQNCPEGRTFLEVLREVAGYISR
jgi:hypothetical protein